MSEASESAFGEEAALFKDPTEPKKNYRSLPEWLDGAWRVLDRFPHLEGALGSFYESIQLNFHHPSFALGNWSGPLVDCLCSNPAALDPDADAAARRTGVVTASALRSGCSGLQERRRWNVVCLGCATGAPLPPVSLGGERTPLITSPGGPCPRRSSALDERKRPRRPPARRTGVAGGSPRRSPPRLPPPCARSGAGRS